MRTSKSLLGGLLVVALTTGLGAAQAGAQSDVDPAVPSSTPPATVAGAGTPESTTSTVVAVLPPAGAETPGEEPLTDSERAARALRWVTIALAALGLLTAVAEVVFWRRTDPSRLLAQEAAQVGTVSLAAATGSPVAQSAWSTAPVEPPVAVPVGAAEGGSGFGTVATPVAEEPGPRRGAFSEPFVIGEVEGAVAPTGFFDSAAPLAEHPVAPHEPALAQPFVLGDLGEAPTPSGFFDSANPVVEHQVATQESAPAEEPSFDPASAEARRSGFFDSANPVAGHQVATQDSAPAGQPSVESASAEARPAGFFDSANPTAAATAASPATASPKDDEVEQAAPVARPAGFFDSANPAERKPGAGSAAGHGLWASSGWDEPADDAATSEDSTEEGAPRVQRPNRRKPLGPRGYFDSPGANPFKPKD